MVQRKAEPDNKILLPVFAGRGQEEVSDKEQLGGSGLRSSNRRSGGLLSRRGRGDGYF